MSSTVKSLAVLVTLIVAGAGSASAWERTQAPIEFATRSARPAPSENARAQVAAVAAAPSRRLATTAMDQPDILYGYGRASARSSRAPLDLRGTLRAPGGGEMLADNAFDEAPSVFEQPAAQSVSEALDSSAVEQASIPATAPPSAEAPFTRAAPETAGGYFVQVGAFANPENAERAKAALKDVGSVTIDQRQGGSATLHRVRLGQWPTRAAAELACDMIVERGFVGAVVSGGR